MERILYIVRGFLVCLLFHNIEYWDSNPNRDVGPMFWRRYMAGDIHTWYGRVIHTYEMKKFSYEYVGRWFVDSRSELYE